MRYRSGMKAAIVKRILPPTNESVTDVSRDTGVSTASGFDHEGFTANISHFGNRS